MLTVVRAPLCVPLACWGNGILRKSIVACLDKNVYISIMESFASDSITFKYSQVETVKDPQDFSLPYLRTVFSGVKERGMEISTLSDIKAGFGLSSESAFSVSLLRALYSYLGHFYSNYKIAKLARSYEHCDCLSNGFFSNHFPAAFGGLRYYETFEDGFVKSEPIVSGSKVVDMLSSQVYLSVNESEALSSNWPVFLAAYQKFLADYSASPLANADVDLLLNGLNSGSIDAISEVFKHFYLGGLSELLEKYLPALSQSMKQLNKSGAAGILFADKRGYTILTYYPFDRAPSLQNLSPFFGLVIQPIGAQVVFDE